MKQDYYEVLGVSRSATDKELKKQYRTLVKKYHPDTNPGDQQAEQKFREVQSFPFWRGWRGLPEYAF